VKRIICIGNRYKPEDAAGPLVCEYLGRSALPPDVEVIDGALADLDLLRFVEPAERVVFVDAALDCGTLDRVAVFTAAEVEQDAPGAYDHSAGLAYCLRAWRCAAERPLPETFVVGIAGVPNCETVRAAAELCVSVARDGFTAEHRPAVPSAGGAS
jgi:hydrogenase maturation protease